MMSLLQAGIAIHTDQEHLILPAQINPGQVTPELKNRLLTHLRSAQMDAAGFYTALPHALIGELQAAHWLAVKVETTADTRFSSPLRIHKHSRVGDETWLSYRAKYPGSIAKTRPRLRILSVYSDGLGVCSWDLDRLTTDDRRRLMDTVVRDKIVIGHNLGGDLSWLFPECDARPRFVLDTMLLTRFLRPQRLLKPFRLAVHGDAATQARCRELIARNSGRPSTSADWIATSLQVAAPDSVYEAHTNWGVTVLSPNHRRYVAEAVRFSLEVLQTTFPDAGIEDMPDLIRACCSSYEDYAAALVRLAEVHVRGIPFDSDAAAHLLRSLSDELGSTVDQLVQQYPAFTECTHELLDPGVGETAEQTCALRVSLAESEAHADQRDAGVSVWVAEIQRNKSRQRMVKQYISALGNDGRLHPQITFTTATGRTVSTTPTVQNIPRDSRFRNLIKARPGHLILSVDYSAMELRSGSVLADRAIADLRWRIESRELDNWFLILARRGMHARRLLPLRPEPTDFSWGWLEHAVPPVVQRVLNREPQSMATVFLRGLDPHLVTAADMARRQGRLAFDGNAIDWVYRIDAKERDDTKEQFGNERQKAKAANFGLLYGMSVRGLHSHGVETYSLKWSQEEARFARNAWFDLYPEFRVWHWYTQYVQARSISKDAMTQWNSRTSNFEVPRRNLKLYETSTLADRPIRVLDNQRQALSHQNQGTGADILASAIASLPQDVAAMMLMPVHDELVFEVPAAELDVVRRTVIEMMTRAADHVLKGSIPVHVEVDVGDTWGSG